MVDMNKTADNFNYLVSIIARLREPGGCPWDREQDYSTLGRYIIEEAYELIEAIESGRPAAICEECGDLLLQVIFVARIAEELGDFDIAEAMSGLSRKLIRRHPHVFAGTDVKDSDEVLKNWEQIKVGERRIKNEDFSVLAGVPRGLPSLLRAARMQERAGKVGFDWPKGDIAPVLAKAEEEIAELKEALASNPNSREVKEEIGDTLFALVNLSRHLKIDPEAAVQEACEKFARRFRYVEDMAYRTGRGWDDFTLDELEGYWVLAKENEIV